MDNLKNVLIFNNKIKGLFGKILVFLGKWAFWSQKVPFPQRNWNKWFFFEFFWKFRNFFDFPEKTEKNYKLYVCQKSVKVCL